MGHTYSKALVKTLYGCYVDIPLLLISDSPKFTSTVTSEPSSLALDIVSAVTSDQNMYPRLEESGGRVQESSREFQFCVTNVAVHIAVEAMLQLET